MIKENYQMNYINLKKWLNFELPKSNIDKYLKEIIKNGTLKII